MVTSGKSGRSESSTAPIDIPVSAGVSGAVTSAARTAVFVGLGSGEEHQAELADLDLVAVGQHSRVDRLPVDVGAVEAAHVDDLKLTVLQPELRVATTHGDVVEEDVAVGMSPGGRGRLVEQEA